MNYEEKYKQALERAKYALDTDMDDSGHWAVNYIFPELKESEDERIRKKVIEVLKLNIKGAESQMQASRGVDRCFEIYACNKVIAWLEKQGKQHPHVDVNKMVDKFAHTEVKGYGVPSMIEVDAYRRGIEAALKYCLTYQI